MSRAVDGFTEEQRKVFEELPIDATVLQALSLEEKASMKGRLDVLKALNGCNTVRDACETLARKLVWNFGWAHVSILRVDRTAGSVNLLAQHWFVGKEKIRLADEYSQPIDVGILGRVVRNGAVQNVADVLKDPGLPSWRGVRGGSVGAVRADLRGMARGAFAGSSTSRTRAKVPFAADAMCGARRGCKRGRWADASRQRTRDPTQCFEHAADPVFVTDGELRVRRTNGAAVAAARVQRSRSDISGDFAGLFEDPNVRSRLIGCVGRPRRVRDAARGRCR